MILFFQILFLLFALFAALAVIAKYRAHALERRSAFFWVLFWAAATAVVFWPNGAQMLAQFFGIGRGADVVLYLSVALIFYLLFRLNVKLDSVGRDITALVRKRSLEDAPK